MSNLFEKLKKRRAFPVKEIDGVFIRLLTQGEKPRADAFTDSAQKAWFILGKCLCDQAGQPCDVQRDNESDNEFASRIRDAFVDVDDGVLFPVLETLKRLSSGELPPLETIAKN